MSSDEGGFFSRWSRRKTEVRSGATVAPEAPAPSPAASRDAMASATPAVNAVPVAGPASHSAPTAISPTPSPTAAPDESPALTLDDVRQLTPDADFTPFVARDVAPEVRNAAFKKLFADPKFNVMDGLDIYIDDYSKPDPLPVSLARQLVSARSLGLFDEAPASTVEPAAVGTDAVVSPIGTPPGADVVEPLEGRVSASSADPNADTSTSTDIEPPPTQP